MGLIYLRRFTVVPYKIYGIKLWSVEENDGLVERYCNSKFEADMLSDKLNKESN